MSFSEKCETMDLGYLGSIHLVVVSTPYRKIKIRLTQWMMMTILSYPTVPPYPLLVIEYRTGLTDVMGDPVDNRAS